MSNPNAYKNSTWKKGECPNPGGVPSGLTIYRRILRELSREELTLLFSDFIRKTPAELMQIIKDPKTSCKDLAIANAVKRWVITGDIQIVNKFLDLIYGDPKKAGEKANQQMQSKESGIAAKPEDFVLSFDSSLTDV